MLSATTIKVCVAETVAPKFSVLLCLILFSGGGRVYVGVTMNDFWSLKFTFATISVLLVFKYTCFYVSE